MHTSPTLTVPRITSPYQPLLSTADTTDKTPPPATPAIARHLGFASSSPERVTLGPPRETGRPSGRGWPYWLSSLLGITLLGGMAGVIGYSRLRAGNADRATGIRQHDLPIPLPLQALNGGEFTRPPATENMTKTPVSASSVLAPYRDHGPITGDEAYAAGFYKKNSKIIKLLKRKHFLPAEGKPSRFSMEETTAAALKHLSSKKGSKVKNNFAKLILAATGIDGDYQHETLSSAQVDIAIRQWLFDNMLGSSPDIAMAISVSKDKYPFMFTVDSLRYLLSSEGLPTLGKVNFTALAEADQAILESHWDSAVQKEIPLLAYYGKDPQVKCLSLDDVEFASLFSGALFLNENGIALGDFHWREVVKTGGVLWDIALRDGVNENMLRYYSLPALLFQAINHPHRLKDETGSNPLLLRSTALDEYLAHRVLVQKALEDLDDKCNRYKNAVDHWLTRSLLADRIIEGCPTDTVFPLTIMVHPAMTLEQRNSEGKKLAKEAYLNNVRIPCKTAPQSIDSEYEKYTRTVAERFAELDELHIINALSAVEKEERDFILSDLAIIHRLRIIPIIKANGIFPALRENGASHYDFDNIKDADIFSVSLGVDTRYYALNGMILQGYDISRFDQYIHHDDSAEFNTLHPLIAYFGGQPEKSLIKNVNQKNDSLVTFLTNSHREIFYNSLYQSGYAPSDLQKIWAVAKHMIPLYDCVVSALAHDVERAVPACLLDAVAFFGVAMKIINLNQKFASSLINGFSKSKLLFADNPLTKSILHAAGSQIVHHVRLPTGVELMSVMNEAFRAIDPGFQLIPAISRYSLRKLIKHFEQYVGDRKFENIIAKLTSAERKHIMPPPAMLDDNLKYARDEMHISPKTIGQSANTDLAADAAQATGGKIGQTSHHVNDGNRLLAPVKEHTPQTVSETPSGRVHDGQKIQFMFNNNPWHPAQPLGLDNPLVNLNNIPNRSGFMEPMNAYYAIAYPNKFDHTNKIADSIKQHYASPTSYQFGYGEDILKIPKEFFLLRKHISTFIQEVDLAHSHAALVKNLFHRTTMTLPDGTMQYPARNKIKSYLAKVLQTDDETIISQAMARLRYHTGQIVSYFETTKNSIIFATCSTVAHPYAYRAESPMGFTYADDVKSRIIIMADNFYTSQTLSTLPRHTALHEISHHSGSLDFLVSPTTSKVGDASEFVESFDDALTQACTDYVDISDDFTRAFNYNLGNRALGKQQIRQLMLRDPMLKANAIMDNADFIARFITDIAENKPYNFDFIKPKNKRSAAQTPEKIRLNAIMTFIYKMAMNSVSPSAPEAI